MAADYVQNMYITDPSLAADEGEDLPPELERLKEGVEVLVFCSDLNLFPRIAQQGDLIRFHRVAVWQCSQNPASDCIAL